MPGFSSKVTIFPFSHSVLSKWVIKSSLYSRGKIILNLRRRRFLYMLLWVLEERFIYSSPLINWLNYLCHCRHTNIYFILWTINQQHAVYFVAQIILVLAIESSFRVVPVTLDMTHLFFFSTTYLFLLSGNTKYYRLILYFPYPNPGISHFS